MQAATGLPHGTPTTTPISAAAWQLCSHFELALRSNCQSCHPLRRVCWGLAPNHVLRSSSLGARTTLAPPARCSVAPVECHPAHPVRDLVAQLPILLISDGELIETLEE